MRLTSIALLAMALISISGCKMEQHDFSTDLQRFRSMIRVDADIRSIRWEVFGTPEYTGGVPGPTDYVTLVAEAEIANVRPTKSSAGPGDAWIAPEAARSWLGNDFKSILYKHRNSRLDFSTTPTCVPIKALLVATNTTISGFACGNSARTLLYFTIADNSEKDETAD
jgi:hypothetical protein